MKNKSKRFSPTIHQKVRGEFISNDTEIGNSLTYGMVKDLVSMDLRCFRCKLKIGLITYTTQIFQKCLFLIKDGDLSYYCENCKINQRITFSLISVNNQFAFKEWYCGNKGCNNKFLIFGDSLKINNIIHKANKKGNILFYICSLHKNHYFKTLEEWGVVYGKPGLKKKESRSSNKCSYPECPNAKLFTKKVCEKHGRTN